MKQEIIIQVQMKCDKCRTKAMEVVASGHGVESVSLAGKEKDILVVVGDGVDSVNLASTLRKKVGYTDIITVGELKKNIGKKDSEEKEKEKNIGKKDSEEKEKEKDIGKKDSEEEKEKNIGKKDSKEKEKEKEKDKEKKKGKKENENENEKVKEKDGKEDGNHAQKYQRNEPSMEYVHQWYPSYPAPPQVIVYENPNYSNPNCSIM